MFSGKLYLTFALFWALILLPAEFTKAGHRPDASEHTSTTAKTTDVKSQQPVQDSAPQFRQLTWKNDKQQLNYNLFIPKGMEKDKKYPLVLFLADAGSPEQKAKLPFSQDSGGVFFASKDSQQKHPCYVLIPQLSGTTVADDYTHTQEVDAVLAMLNDIAASNQVDPSRIYIAGQSVCGMMAMYLNSNFPNIFAASLYADCHWDSGSYDKLVQHPFIFFYDKGSEKSYKTMQALDEAARKMDQGFTWSEWSAKLPLAEQNRIAQTMLAKGQPVNLFGFEDGTIALQDQKDSAFNALDCAFRLESARDWLFQHSLK